MSTIYIREQGQIVPLDIPECKGERGEPGATPDLQVGSVTALPNDQQASVTIQGDKENPTINFGIPSGMTRDKGLYVGRPEDAYDETKVVFDDENWVDDTYFKNSTIDYMGGEHKSLKGKSDSDVEYILRKIGTQHYEGSSITATNTYAMQVKSAMFKGQTLENLSEINKFSLSGSGSTVITAKSDKFKINTVYTRVVFITKNTLTGSSGGNVAQPHKGDTETVFTVDPSDGIPEDFTGLLQKRKFTTPSTPLTNYHHQMSAIRIYSVNTGGVLEGYEIILEGDYTNQDIPWFEGMKSVKSPSLVSVGKNLGDFTKNLTVEFGEKEVSANRLRLYSEIAPHIWNMETKYNFHCEVGEKISVQLKINKNKNGRFSVSVYDGNVLKRTTTLNSGLVSGECKISFVATTNNIKIDICPTFGNNYKLPYDVTIYNFQIERGNMTQYEPYKSRTLATPSDLELRSNGNVYDELDLITSKLTQRIGDDGSVLPQEVIKTVDLKGQKIYSYDGTTHYMTSSLQEHPIPILSIDVPTDIISLIKHQQNTINQQILILSEREEMQNILIDSTLSRYEQTLLTATHISEEEVPNYIQKLYEVAYKRGIRIKEGEL